MLFLAPLRKKFMNVANPQKVFSKPFIAAALVGFVGAYSAAGTLVWTSIKKEWNDKNFQTQNLHPFNLARKHGSNAGIAMGISYVGDVSLIYAGAGMLYWRRRRKEKLKIPAENTPL